MLVRTLLTVVNLGTIAAAVAVLFAFPQYSGTAFYLLLGWMFGSLVLIYGPWANRTIGAPAHDGPPSAGPGAAPLPSAAPSTDLGFCIYCAAPLANTAAVCPACGHRAVHM